MLKESLWFSVQFFVVVFCTTEFLDEVQMRASIQYSKLEGLLEQPTLFLEFNGSETSVEEQAKAVSKSAFTSPPSSQRVCPKLPSEKGHLDSGKHREKEKGSSCGLVFSLR